MSSGIQEECHCLFIKGWIDICFIIHNNNNNNNTHTHTVHCQNTCPCEMNWKGSTSRRENRQQCPIAHIRIWHFGYSCWVFLSHRVGTHHFRPRCGKKNGWMCNTIWEKRKWKKYVPFEQQQIVTDKHTAVWEVDEIEKTCWFFQYLYLCSCTFKFYWICYVFRSILLQYGRWAWVSMSIKPCSVGCVMCVPYACAVCLLCRICIIISW